MTNLLRRTAASTALAMVAALLANAGPAEAASLAATSHVSIVGTPGTAEVGTVVAVTGAVTPRVSGLAVSLQRLTGKKWVTISHVKPTRLGAYTFNLRAPKKATTWILRTTRAASRTSKAAVSGTIHVGIVKAFFAVTATPGASSLTSGATLGITGKISPAATGTVELERQAATGGWVPYASSRISAGSVYAFATPLTTGSYTFRVLKNFTTKVAAGASRPFTVTVTAAVLTPPPAPVQNPVISTVALPKIVVGVAYTATLVATLGTAPYTWAVTSGALPPGLLLSVAGLISGRPTSSGTFSATLTVTDSAGHTAALTSGYLVHPVSVSAWGYNGEGALGNNTTTLEPSPVADQLPDGIQTISANNDYSLALRADGTVWATGSNGDGQLGINSTTETHVPVQIPGLANVVSIAAGLTSAYAVEANGTLWSWGSNNNGELGNGATSGTPTLSPIEVSGVSSAVSVAAGESFALVLLTNGTVRAWGRGDNGELGNTTTTIAQDTPVTVTGTGPTGTPAIAISAGLQTGYALMAGGTIESWGSGLSGALGNNTTTVTQATPVTVMGVTDATAIAANEFEGGYALRANGTVLAWGYGNDGELGDGVLGESNVPVAVSGLTGVTAIAAGRLTGYAITGAGRLEAWGDDTQGELGDGNASSVDDADVPQAVPGLTNVVSAAGGQAFAYAVVAG